MARLLESAHAGEFPLYTMCVFEVLENVPGVAVGAEKTRHGYEKCPACPLLQKYCYEGARDGSLRPSVSKGHYKIGALIQKLKTVGTADIRGRLPLQRPQGRWALVPQLRPGDPRQRRSAEYDPALPVNLSDRLGGLHRGRFLPGHASTRPGCGEARRSTSSQTTSAKEASAEVNARDILEMVPATLQRPI